MALIWDPGDNTAKVRLAVHSNNLTANKRARCRSTYACSFSPCFEKESDNIPVQVGVHRGKRKHEGPPRGRPQSTDPSADAALESLREREGTVSVILYLVTR